jgi:hypothetical protein
MTTPLAGLCGPAGEGRGVGVIGPHGANHNDAATVVKGLRSRSSGRASLEARKVSTMPYLRRAHDHRGFDAARFGELPNALRAHAEHLGDFGGGNDFHRRKGKRSLTG